MNLTELSKQIYTQAREKGFYRETSEKGTGLMLIVRELSEALEADRNTLYANLNYYKEEIKADDVNEDEREIHNQIAYQNHISGTFEEELADSVIQLLSFCGSLKIDIDTFVKLKIQYNKTRPKRHNKKY
jgi:NTP pyrophosphatase (non-canonical NTP hydrolase)